MNYFSLVNVHTLSVTLIDIFGIILAFWVYFTNPREKTNRGFLLMVLGILSWITFYHLASLPSFKEISLLLFRLANGSVFLFFIAYYFFIIEWFLEKKGRYDFLGKLVLGYGLVFGLISTLTKFTITSLQLENWGVFPIFTPWGWFAFYGYVILLTVLINVVLLKSYTESSKERKLKIQYFLIGLIIFAVLNFIFNVILPIFFKNYKLYYLGNYSIIFLIGFTAYAMKKHRLFDIAKTKDYISTYVKDVTHNISYGLSVTSDNEVHYVLKYFHNRVYLESSSLLELAIVKQVQVQHSLTPIDALILIFKQTIDYFKMDVIEPDRRTKQNLKYHILKMIALDQAEEGQILWELGFEGYPVKIMQMEKKDRPPKFREFAPSDYTYVSRNAFIALKKEAVHDVTWRISYLEKLSKKR